MENISEIYKNNKLIAEFMGYSNVLDETEDLMYYPDWFIPNPIKEKKNNKNRTTSIELFRYHKSWEWLMPVIEKILNLDIVTENMELYYAIIDNIPDIKKTYKEIVNFIKQYNDR